jgi:hypothetical protein
MREKPNDEDADNDDDIEIEMNQATLLHESFVYEEKLNVQCLLPYMVENADIIVILQYPNQSSSSSRLFATLLKVDIDQVPRELQQATSSSFLISLSVAVLSETHDTTPALNPQSTGRRYCEELYYLEWCPHHDRAIYMTENAWCQYLAHKAMIYPKFDTSHNQPQWNFRRCSFSSGAMKRTRGPRKTNSLKRKKTKVQDRSNRYRSILSPLSLSMRLMIHVKDTTQPIMSTESKWISPSQRFARQIFSPSSRTMSDVV